MQHVQNSPVTSTRSDLVLLITRDDGLSWRTLSRRLGSKVSGYKSAIRQASVRTSLPRLAWKEPKEARARSSLWPTGTASRSGKLIFRVSIIGRIAESATSTCCHAIADIQYHPAAKYGPRLCGPPRCSCGLSSPRLLMWPSLTTQFRSMLTFNERT